ncbi:MAG: hypothetical protein WCU00_12910 [Candidatus Latescibacterota bacterium]
MGNHKNRGIFASVFRELFVEIPKVGIQQITGSTPKRKKPTTGQTIYVTIERHHHHHEWHKPEVKK